MISSKLTVSKCKSTLIWCFISLLNVYFRQREKVTVHIQTDTKNRSVLTQKGKNIFRKSTALQSTDRWMTSSVTCICEQIISDWFHPNLKRLNILPSCFRKSREGVCDLYCFLTHTVLSFNLWSCEEAYFKTQVRKNIYSKSTAL